MIKETIKIPVYNCNVIVIIDTYFNMNNESKRLCKKYKIKHDTSDYACMIGTDTYKLYYILFSKNHLSINHLVHEITHLGGTILNNRDIATDGDSEAFAYLNGFLAEAIKKVMDDNNLEFV